MQPILRNVYALALGLVLAFAGTAGLGKAATPSGDEVCEFFAGYDGDLGTLCGSTTPLPAAYPFSVAIQRGAPGANPKVLGGLPDGCTFAATSTLGTVTCSPQYPITPGMFWACALSEVLATATSGTVHGKAHCKHEPVVAASATAPAASGAVQSDPGYFTHPPLDFPWVCQAQFTAAGTGVVACGTA